MTKMVLNLGYSRPTVHPSSSRVSLCWVDSLICTLEAFIDLPLLSCSPTVDLSDVDLFLPE